MRSLAQRRTASVQSTKHLSRFLEESRRRQVVESNLYWSFSSPTTSQFILIEVIRIGLSLDNSA